MNRDDGAANLQASTYSMISKDLCLEYVDKSSIVDLVDIYRRNWPQNEVLLNNVEEEHFKTILNSREFVFGYILRYKGNPAVFMLFVRQREGVLNVLEFCIEGSYPFVLASAAKYVGARLLERAAQLGFRKLEAVAEKANFASLRTILFFGSEYSNTEDVILFESYLPSILCISEITDCGNATTPQFNIRKDFLKIARSYTRSLKVSQWECTFQVQDQGFAHIFNIDRLAEACASLKKEGHFEVTCAPSARLVHTSEPAEISLLIKNLSHQCKSVDASLHLQDFGNLLEENASIGPSEEIILKTFIRVDEPGIYHIRGQCRINQNLMTLRTAFCVLPPLEMDFSTNSFITRPAGSPAKLNLRIFNRRSQRSVCKLAVSSPMGVNVHPVSRTLIIKPQSFTDLSITMQTNRNALLPLECRLTCASRRKPEFEARSSIYIRACKRKTGCVGNITNNLATLKNDRLSLAINLRTGSMYLRPHKPRLFDVFHPWDEIGPPFSEYYLATYWPTKVIRTFSDLNWKDPGELAWLRSIWRNKKISAEITKNSPSEATIELTDNSDDFTMRKVISLHSNSVVRFQTQLSCDSGLSHNPIRIKAQPIFRCAEGTRLYMPIDSKDSPVMFDALREKHKAFECLKQDSFLSEKWVCYDIERLGYSFGLFWEGSPFLDFFHQLHMKLPWLEFKGDVLDSGNVLFPPYYFWAGAGGWRRLRQLSLDERSRWRLSPSAIQG